MQNFPYNVGEMATKKKGSQHQLSVYFDDATWTLLALLPTRGLAGLFQGHRAC